MARNQIAIKIAMRKDESVKSPGYGTFKLEAHVAKDQTPQSTKATPSLTGFYCFVNVVTRNV